MHENAMFHCTNAVCCSVQLLWTGVQWYGGCTLLVSQMHMAQQNQQPCSECCISLQAGAALPYAMVRKAVCSFHAIVHLMVSCSKQLFRTAVQRSSMQSFNVRMNSQTVSSYYAGSRGHWCTSLVSNYFSSTSGRKINNTSWVETYQDHTSRSIIGIIGDSGLKQ